MSGYRPEDAGTAPTVEVTVIRDGEVIDRVLCESDEEAVEVVESWSEQDGVHCQVDDLSVRHRSGDILEPGEPELSDTGERRTGPSIG
jgi:hypothetical protein